MLQRYWSGVVLALLGVLLLGAPAQAQTLKWKAFEDKTPFFQKLKTNTTQELTVQGMKNKQVQDQTFWFKWTPKGEKDKKYEVDQEIVGLQMTINIGGNKIEFDSFKKNQPKNPMTEFFNSLVGTKFTLTIDKDTMKVDKVDGVKKMVEKLTAVNQSMKPLLDKILTEDSVKQMANPVLGVVPPGGKIPASGKWGGDMVTLDMGPIGSYQTTNSYEVAEADKKKKIIPIKVTTTLKYIAPTEKAARDLPFIIKKGDGTKLESTDASGTINFDTDKGRIQDSTMKVKLGGKLTVEIASNETVVDLDQEQDVTLTTYDTNSQDLPDALKEEKKEKKEKSK